MNVKRQLVSVLLTSAFACMAFGRQDGQNKARAVASARPSSVQELLTQMERDWAKAIIERDTKKIREIVAPDVVLTTPDGTMRTLEDDIAEMKSGAFTANLYDSYDMRVKLYGNCAVVTGRTKLQGKYKNQDVQDQFRWTDTFIRRKGRWQIVASQATPISRIERQ